MKRKEIKTGDAPSAIGPYSQAVSDGAWLFISGQIGLDPETGSLVPGGLVAETRQALRNIESILKAAGHGMDDLVAVDVYLTDINDFQRFNEVYAETFKDFLPARAVVEVSALPKGARVEIKSISIKRKDI